MSSKKPQRAAFLFRDPAAARALPVLPPTGKPSGAMTGARRKSGAVRRCEPGEPITTVTPDPWYLGYATALAEIWRLHHDGQMVRHILAAGGLTLKHLELGGVEERDLAAIRDACLGTRSEVLLADRPPVEVAAAAPCAEGVDRLLFDQSERWHKAHGGLSGVDSVYSQQRCCYCARPTGPDAVRLRTARTNDGEWWLVGPTVDVAALEWRDFQDQLDGTFAPTLLPVGPDCLRNHPEWRFAVVELGTR